MKKITLSQMFRRIQKLQRATPTDETLADLEFYQQVSTKLTSLFGPDYVSNLDPIGLNVCPIERAQELALELGMNVVLVKAGTVYLSWAEGINDEE